VADHLQAEQDARRRLISTGSYHMEVPAPAERMLVLNGQPTVQDFVRNVKRSAIDGYNEDDVLLAREWNRARDHMRELEVTQRGFADAATVAPLPHSMNEIAESEPLDAETVRSVQLLPYRWGLVELDRMVIYQKGIDLSYAERVQASLPSRLTDEQVFRIAMGNSCDHPPVDVTTVDGNTFVFTSPSLDLRILSATPFNPTGKQPPNLFGHATAALGVFVGYGSNLLQAVHLHDRLLLMNGTHRAYVLRSSGVTHVPCLIQYASTRDDLDVVASLEIKSGFDRYFMAKRPPVFKDYFDDHLRKIIPVRRRKRVLQVQVTIQRSLLS
jgi:hypothetical protein